MKQNTNTGWFRDTGALKVARSYWIYAGKGRHYLGHYRGRGDWSWTQPDAVRRNPPSGRPPDGTKFLAYREVTDIAFAPILEK